jgi:cell division protease FtsH
MASLPGPLQLPNPESSKNKKEKIDIPYNRWDQRRRRAVKSFVKWFIIISLLVTIYFLATIDDVSLNIFFVTISTALGLALQIFAILMGIILQFGLIFWFLGRPRVEVVLPGEDTSVTFDDYWGQPQLVALVKQWMHLLRDRKEFEKMGGKHSSGILLYGPPGTGKTMLAKAVAGESGMAFLSAQGTSFQGMFWGMDILMVMGFARRARKLAKKYGGCVAYIDEIDAIGQNRGGVRGGGMIGGGMMGMGMGMMALSTLLSQMDGINAPTRKEKWLTKLYAKFGKRYKIKRDWHVFWMGSTNRPDVLDPALTRSGRLDTMIAVEPPDRASRRKIIEGYLSKIKTDDTVDIEAIVADTNGTTPADIATIITKNSVRIAFFGGRRVVSQKDIDKALLEHHSGMEMPIEEMDEHQRRVLAYHEAGHAIAQYYMMPEQKIVRVTIVRLSTGSYGHMAPIDTVEQHITPVIRIAYDIIVFLAGRASEKIFSGEMYQSVGGDFPGVRYMMWRLIENGFFGPPLAGGENGPAGHSYNQYLRGDEPTLKKYWLVMEDATEKLLRRHWKEVTAVAEELLVKGTINGKEAVDLIEANQTADSLEEENIIPKTLAAIRAQAIAEIRNGKNGHNGNGNGHLLEQPNTPVHAGDQVVVINGASNGVAQQAELPPAPVGVANDDQPKQPENDSGPTMISGGMGDFQPPVLNDGTGES